jgi:hypothetical protein
LLTVKFLTTYGRRPMHLFGGVALAIATAAVLLALVGLVWSPILSPLTSLAIVLGLLIPLVLYLQGLQAELVASTRTDEPYSIVERVG